VATALLLSTVALVGCRRFEVVVPATSEGRWLVVELDPNCERPKAAGARTIMATPEGSCTGHELFGRMAISYFAEDSFGRRRKLRRGEDITQATVVEQDDRRFFVFYFGKDPGFGPTDAVAAHLREEESRRSGTP
jgi:hypothetical protein